MYKNQKAIAIKTLIETPGWKILEEYLLRNSIQQLISIDKMDSLIKQSFQSGVCQGHKDVLLFIKSVKEFSKRQDK